MKTITKKLAALGVVGAGLVLAGCAQSNEGTMNVDPNTGKPSAPGVTPPGAARSSKDAYNKQKSPMSDPANAKSYKDSQG